MSVLLYICVIHEYSTHDQNGVSGTLELEFQMALIHHVGSGNTIQGLHKSNKCFNYWDISPGVYMIFKQPLGF